MTLQPLSRTSWGGSSHVLKSSSSSSSGHRHSSSGRLRRRFDSSDRKTRLRSSETSGGRLTIELRLHDSPSRYPSPYTYGGTCSSCRPSSTNLLVLPLKAPTFFSYPGGGPAAQKRLR